jgi:AcrR family transcriptional regulator
MNRDHHATSRQSRVGGASRQRTRDKIVRAAAEEFAAAGYVGATIGRIAERASVSVQTIYLACGNKRSLLQAYLLDAISSGAPPAEQLARRVTADDSAVAIVQVAHIVRTVAERSGIPWMLYRDAAAVDPEIAADWQELQLRRRGTFAAMLARIPDHDLRVGRAETIDTAWAIASPEMYELLVRREGYSLDQFESWLATTLAAALLRP